MRLTETSLANWPSDRPRPTDAEIADAYARWSAEGAKEHAAGDFYCDFNLTLSTWSSWCWLRFFFPNEVFIPDGIYLPLESKVNK